MNLWVIFITGLTVGGLTCLAVQGGLLASLITVKEEDGAEQKRNRTITVTSVFIIAKLLAYIVLGGILGAFGGALNISTTVQSFMQLIAGIYMIAVALNLLEVHPLFRYVILQPPRFLTRLVRNQSKSKDIFAPFLLGAMTIFIPCGTTLAMEALAISSSNALSGAAIMGAFIVGTIPLFFGIGVVTSLLGDAFRTKFLKIAAIAVIYLGLSSVNGALVVLGSPVTFQTLTNEITSLVRDVSSSPSKQNSDAIQQNVDITITSSGYSPNYFRVKTGQLVTLKLITKNAYSCASAFRIPSLGIAKNLQPNETQTITFTPMKSGKIPFSCSMGMYQGTIDVI